MRLLTGLLGLSAIIGFGWIAMLPNKAKCVATGRVVDPTERHCEAADGFVQLQEHALYHASEIVAGVGFLLVIAFAVRWYVRRRRTLAAG